VIAALCAHDAEAGPVVLIEVLARAAGIANSEVARRAAEDPARLGMGTTLTAMLWSGDRAVLAHIGDSRAFRLRDGQLRQITDDHVIGKLVSHAGALAPVLTRYFDGRPDRFPDLTLHGLRPGDRYLLCSDGLSPVVASAMIHGVLATAADSAEAARQLVALAEAAGGPDNISVIVLDVGEGSAEEACTAPVILGAASAELLAR
jgi:protein phosphatase